MVTVLKFNIHDIKISITGKVFVAHIAFSREIGVGFNILGRKNIFDKFIVCFNEKEKEISFTPCQIEDFIYQ
jgi:hypothetical protein